MYLKSKTLIAYCVVIFLIIFLHFSGWIRSFESLIRDIVQPGSQVLYEWSVAISDEQFSNPEELAAAYKKLKEAYTRNQIDAARLALITRENAELREQLLFFDKNTSAHVGANVIGKSVDPLSNTILIDKGEQDYVVVNDPVVAAEGVLIGRITMVQEKQATVRLINDDQSKVGATLINRERSIGLVEGGFGISVQMTFIPQNESVTIGDLVVTSGLSDDMPRGLLIGTVESVEKQPYQPFQMAIISPAVDLDRLLIVSVLTRE